jgi:type III pantothenate kinase
MFAILKLFAKKIYMTLLLAVDTGNSDTVFGLFQQEKCIFQWRMQTSIKYSVAEYGLFLRTSLLEASIKLADIQTVVYSSVVPLVTPIIQQMLATLFTNDIIFVEPQIYDTLPIKPINKHEIGADLVANATAAYTRYQSACIVVDFGTALTFTTIANDGTLIGVAIAPGLKTALRALVQNTAQLPDVPLEIPTSALGKNTTQALQAGILLGYTGLVKELVTQIRTELKQPNCPIIATGGLAFVMKPLTNFFSEIDVNLTLDGLRIIGEMQREKTHTA